MLLAAQATHEHMYIAAHDHVECEPTMCTLLYFSNIFKVEPLAPDLLTPAYDMML